MKTAKRVVGKPEIGSGKIIAVVGGTGAQGGALVEALLERGQFEVRVLTRNPDGERAKALVERGVGVVRADLNRPETLTAAFDGAYGAFVVTDFGEHGTDEFEQGKSAVRAAKQGGVKHFIWSTLPNSKEISGGKHAVEHFTGKALVDREVSAPGFDHHSFVEAPFYFQNLLSNFFAPKPLEGGGMGWAMPIDPAKRCIHAGDIAEFGKVVARMFEQPGQVQGAYVSVASEMLSWNDMMEALNAQGHDLRFVRVPAKTFDALFAMAAQIRETFEWFENYTYYGPDASSKIARANALYPEGFTSFAKWSALNMVPAR